MIQIEHEPNMGQANATVHLVCARSLQDPAAISKTKRDGSVSRSSMRHPPSITRPSLDDLIIFLLWMGECEGDLVRTNTLGGHFVTLLSTANPLLKISLVKVIKVRTQFSS